MCYWEHVNAKYHKRMINASRFNRDIMQLCETMGRTWEGGAGAKVKHNEKKKVIAKLNGKRKNPRDRTPKQSCEAKTKESLVTMNDR